MTGMGALETVTFKVKYKVLWGKKNPLLMSHLCGATPHRTKQVSCPCSFVHSISVQKIHNFESVPPRFLLHLHFWQLMSLLKAIANDFACSASPQFSCLKQATAVWCGRLPSVKSSGTKGLQHCSN